MSATAPALQWLRTGQEIFPAMLAAIHAALNPSSWKPTSAPTAKSAGSSATL
jgi:hypothetical protein